MIECSNDGSIFERANCRDYDFTFAFESVFLGIVPIAVFLPFAILRGIKLARTRACLPAWSNSSWGARALIVAKTVTFVVLARASVAALSAGLANQPPKDNPLGAAYLILALISSILIAILSNLEHYRTSRSTMLLPLFLLAMSLSEGFRIRSLVLSKADGRRLASNVTMIVGYTLLFLLENVEKRWILKDNTPPERTASFISQLSFSWVTPLFGVSRTKALLIEDLGSLPSEYASYPEGQKQFLAEVWRGSTHPLFWTLLKAFSSSLANAFVPCCIASLAQIAKPVLINRTVHFISTYSNSNDPAPFEEGYALGFAFLVIGLIYAGAAGQWKISVIRTNVKIRGFLLEGIYRKATQVDVETAKETGSAKASNLVGVDVDRLLERVDNIFELVNASILIVVGLVILWYNIGIAFLGSILSVIVFFTAAPYCSRGVGQLQQHISAAGDARVRLTSSVLRQFRTVKLSGFEKVLGEKINAIRESEVGYIVALGWQLTQIVVLSNYARNLQFLLTITFYGIISVIDSSTLPLTTARMFTTIAVLGLIADPLNHLGQSYSGMLAAWASLKRIEGFLLAPEAPVLHETVTTSELAESIVFSSASLGIKSQEILRDITVTIPTRSLTFVVGKVGSGKSTFLQACIGELDVLQGIASVPRVRTAYCSQDPWLPAQSIRDSIVFMETFDSSWYDRVLHALALDVDIKQMEDGDHTPVTSLSGGQKQRVALARAVYSKADRLVLDDTLSALDATTEAHVYSSLFDPVSGLLAGYTIIISTNNVDLFRHAGLVVVFEDGTISETGSYDALMSSQGSMSGLVKEFSTDVQHKNAETFEKQKGTEELDSEEATDVEKDEGKQSAAGWRAYKAYIRGVGVFRAAMFACLISVNGLFPLFTLLYLQIWSTSMDQDPRRNLLKYLGGYLLIQVVNLSWYALWFSYAMTVAAPSGSRGLHQSLLNGVLSAPVSTIQEVGAGKILNRFSSDMHLIDGVLPSAFMNFMGNIVNVVASLCIVIYTAPWMALVLPIISVAFMLLQKFYTPTSQQLRRLELGTRSPLYALLGDTLDPDGLRTIRAYLGTDFFVKANTTRTTRSQLPFYLLEVVQRWLGTGLDTFGAISNATLVFLAVSQRNTASVGIFAVTLVQISSLSDNLARVFNAWVGMEICVVAADRIDEYGSFDPEELQSSHATPPASWPSTGGVVFKEVSISYNQIRFALQNVSFNIPAGTRVGIVGRTGSGKSTLLAAIFRMMDVRGGGSIKVDSLDISQFSKQDTRAAMSLIPQDPLLLDLSLRENLDLTGAHDDQAIWRVLEQTSMKQIAEALPHRLDEVVGNMFSRGQRQLLALARALLEDRKIICLDEATSSLDVQTDQAIQETLRSAFRDTTIIAVAHRISTIADFDKVLVLDRGKLVEQGSPEELMKKTGGMYRRFAKGEEALG